jgi:hypothetical protein
MPANFCLQKRAICGSLDMRAVPNGPSVNREYSARSDALPAKRTGKSGDYPFIEIVPE